MSVYKSVAIVDVNVLYISFCGPALVDLCIRLPDSVRDQSVFEVSDDFTNGLLNVVETVVVKVLKMPSRMLIWASLI